MIDKYDFLYHYKDDPDDPDDPDEPDPPPPFI